MPILVAPVAFQRLAIRTARRRWRGRRRGAGTVMCLSTLATARPSEVAAAAPGGRHWFQLYCFRDQGVTRALIDEAVEAGFEAIVADGGRPARGRRERDLRSGFSCPRGPRRAERRTRRSGPERAVTSRDVLRWWIRRSAGPTSRRWPRTRACRSSSRAC